MSNPPRRILVLRGGALGDFIVTLPTLVALRERFPEACLELVGNTTAAHLARVRGIVDQAHSQHEARWSALYSPERLPVNFAGWLNGFDVIINYWPDPDRTVAAHFPTRSGQLFLAGSAQPTRAPAAAHFATTVAPLGINPPNWVVPLAPIDATTFPAHREQLVAVHPGSGSAAKNWPRERWIDLIAGLATPVLLIIGEAENKDWNESILHQTTLGRRFAEGSIRLEVNSSLERLVARLRQSRLFLGHDSGISHLAAACEVPCLLLYGPTEPAMWAPPAPHVKTIRHGTDLRSITVFDVRTAIENLGLGELGGRRIPDPLERHPTQ